MSAETVGLVASVKESHVSTDTVPPTPLAIQLLANPPVDTVGDGRVPGHLCSPARSRWSSRLMGLASCIPVL